MKKVDGSKYPDVCLKCNLYQECLEKGEGNTCGFAREFERACDVVQQMWYFLSKNPIRHWLWRRWKNSEPTIDVKKFKSRTGNDWLFFDDKTKSPKPDDTEGEPYTFLEDLYKRLQKEGIDANCVYCGQSLFDPKNKGCDRCREHRAINPKNADKCPKCGGEKIQCITDPEITEYLCPNCDHVPKSAKLSSLHTFGKFMMANSPKPDDTGEK